MRGRVEWEIEWEICQPVIPSGSAAGRAIPNCGIASPSRRPLGMTVPTLSAGLAAGSAGYRANPQVLKFWPIQGEITVTSWVSLFVTVMSAHV